MLLKVLYLVVFNVALLYNLTTFNADSEEETGPRLKPVFVRKRDRVTVIEKEKEKEKQKVGEVEAKKMAEERRRYTLKVVYILIRNKLLR